MAKATLEVLLKADIGNLSRGLRQAKQSVGKFQKGISQATNSLKSFAKNIGVAIAGLSAMGYGAVKLGLGAARLNAMMVGLDKRLQKVGSSADVMMRKLREASQGMIEDTELVRGANRAMLLIGDQVATKIPQLMAIAMRAAREMGESQDYMWRSIITGIGRASPRILDNLGLVIRETEVYDAWARQIGKTADELTDAERKTALLNRVLEWGEQTFGDLRGEMEGFDVEWGKLTTEVKNLRTELGDQLLPTLTDTVGTLTDVTRAVGYLAGETDDLVTAAGGLVGAIVAVKAFGAAVIAKFSLAYLAAYKLVRGIYQLKGAIAGLTVEEQAFLDRGPWEELKHIGLGTLGALEEGFERIGLLPEDAMQKWQVALAQPDFAASTEASSELGISLAILARQEAEAAKQAALLSEYSMQGASAMEGFPKDVPDWMRVYAEHVREAALASTGHAAAQQMDTSAMIAAHPAVISLSAAIAGLKQQQLALQDAQAGVSAAIHRVSRALREAQKVASGLSESLSGAKQRLSDLSRPRLRGMRELDKQEAAIEDYINALKLAELTGKKAAAVPGLPADIEALEKMREIIRLRREVEFGPKLRELEAAAREVPEEMAFEQALREIHETKATINSLEAQLRTAEAAVSKKQNAIERLQAASFNLSQAMRDVSKQMQIQQEHLALVTAGLELAFAWFGKDREELIKLGLVSVTQAKTVDQKLREMLGSFTVDTKTKGRKTVNVIQAIVREARLLIAKLKASGLLAQYGPAGGAGIIPPMQEGGYISRTGPYLLHRGEMITPAGRGQRAINLTVRVEGSVVTEKELTEVIRRNLLRLQRRNLTTGLV